MLKVVLTIFSGVAYENENRHRNKEHYFNILTEI